MRVLHLRASQGFYGAEAVILALAEQQIRLGADVHVACLERAGRHGFSERLLSRGINIHAVRSKGRLDLAAGAAVRRLINELRPDVVNSHGYKTDLMLAALRPALPRSVTIVGTNHLWTRDNRALRFYEWLDKYALRRLDRVIAVSGAIRDEMVRAKIPSDDVEVIENGIDYAVLERGPSVQLRAFIHAGPNDLLVGFVGRLTPQKGLSFLIDAAHRLSGRANLRFVLIGDGPLGSELREWIRSRGLERMVHLLGRREDVPALLREIDLLVLPSLREGTPIVLLEAMGLGCPVIATDVGGVRSLVEHGRSGIIVPPGDVTALSRAIERWLDDPADRMRVGACAKAVARSQFTAERMAQRYHEAYRAARARRTRLRGTHESDARGVFLSR